MPLSLIKRAVKGSELTSAEHDTNFTAIETEVNENETEVTALQDSVDSLSAALPAKANLVDGALAVAEIPQVVSISDPTGITGAFAIRNIVGISAADFDLINPNDFPTTTFLVSD